MTRFAAVLSLLVFAALPARAESLDPLIEGAKLCTRHLPRYEREYGIPTHLLSAIASTESGRFHQGLGIKVPWPWTINAEGKGYFFDSKQEAVAAANRLRMQGVKSMDVGCMQVNIMHHPDAFASIEDGFEPQKNIAYAAGFLRGLYEESKSWKTAASSYHSKTPSLGQNYVGLVYNSWYRIIDKLRAARLAVPESSVAAMNDLKSPNTPVPTVQPFKVVTPKAAPEGKKFASYHPPRMNSIRVSDKRDVSRENGIIVVRPDIRVVDEPVPAALTQRAPEILPPVSTVSLAQAPAANPADSGGARIIRIDGETKVHSQTTRGPNFIFSD